MDVDLKMYSDKCLDSYFWKKTKHSLISSFDVHCLDKIIPVVSYVELLVSPCSFSPVLTLFTHILFQFTQKSYGTYKCLDVESVDVGVVILHGWGNWRTLGKLLTLDGNHYSATCLYLGSNPGRSNDKQVFYHCATRPLIKQSSLRLHVLPGRWGWY